MATGAVDQAQLDDLIRSQDFAEIERQDRKKIWEWIEADKFRTVTKMADALGMNRSYFSSVLSGSKPLNEQFAARVNKRFKLGLQGVPARRGLWQRRVIQVRYVTSDELSGVL